MKVKVDYTNLLNYISDHIEFEGKKDFCLDCMSKQLFNYYLKNNIRMPNKYIAKFVKKHNFSDRQVKRFFLTKLAVKNTNEK